MRDGTSATTARKAAFAFAVGTAVLPGTQCERINPEEYSDESERELELRLNTISKKLFEEVEEAKRKKEARTSLRAQDFKLKK